MRKTGKAIPAESDDLRPEYRFDYSKARPNPYADRLKGKVVAVVLDSEVAAAFPTSESVNTALRSVMGFVRRRSSTTRTASDGSGRPDNQTQRKRSAKVKRRAARR